MLILGSVGLAAEPDLAKARDDILHGRYAEGLKALDALLAKPSGKVERDALALRIRARLETGSYNGALADAERLERAAPDSPDALALCADVLIQTGRYDEAAQRLARALERDGAHLQAHLLSLQLAEATGKRDAYDAQVGYFVNVYSQGKATTAEALTAIARAVASEDPHGAWQAYQEAEKADPNCLDALVYGGFHCLDKYAWQFARECFEKALKLNPNLAIAHAGLAGVHLANSSYDAAAKAIEAALKINPRLALAHLQKAALLAVEQRHDASLAEIRVALGVNPNDLDALSLLAAHYEAVGKTAERDKTIEQVLRINPRYADLYATLALACERLRQCPKAIEWGRKAVEQAPDYWRGYYLAGMNLLRSGEESEGYALLDKAFDLNGFNVWAYNTLTVVDRDLKKKEFAYHETPHFFVKLDKTEDAILWPYVEPILEKMYAELTKRYDVTPIGPKQYGERTLVLMYPSHQEFSGRTVGLPGLSATGACLGQVITMPSPRLSHLNPSNPFNWRLVVTHEFAHVLTLQKTRYNIPRWLTEGLSVLEEDDTRIQWDAMLLSALANDQVPPLEDLNSGFTRPRFPTQVPVSYYVSMLVCRYFKDTYGFDSILRMLDMYGDGLQTDEVLPKATGKSMADLDREAMAYIRRYAARIEVSAPVGKETLARLEEEVKKSDKDADLWTRIAAGRLGQGRFGDATKAAQRAVELNPNLARAHGILGLIAQEKDKDTVAAKKHFLRAREADPDHFPAHLYLGLIAEKEGATDQAIEELEAARRLYPRFRQGDKSLQERLADLYVKAGKTEKAIEALREHVSLDHCDPRALSLLGGLLARMRRPAEAAKAYLDAIYIDPYEPETHLAAASAYEAADAIDEAIREYAVAAAIDPKHLATLVGRAEVFAVAGRAADARKAIAAIRRLDPKSDDAARIEKLLKK